MPVKVSLLTDRQFAIPDSLRSDGRTDADDDGRRCGNTVYPSSFVEARRRRRGRGRQPSLPLSLPPSLVVPLKPHTPFKGCSRRRREEGREGGRERRSGAGFDALSLSLRTSTQLPQQQRQCCYGTGHCTLLHFTTAKTQRERERKREKERERERGRKRERERERERV